MSWAEVKKINNNMKIPLNEQIRNNQFQSSYVFSGTLNETFKPDKTGYYKIIVVGAGGAGGSTSSGDYLYYATGGAGGVAIKNMRLLSTQEYSITINGTSIFNEQLQATPGGNGQPGPSGKGGAGGTASGGDFNYDGVQGKTEHTTKTNSTCTLNGSSVGVFIPGLMLPFTTESGLGILGYGYGGVYASDKTGEAAIIIIPLELEE